MIFWTIMKDSSIVLEKCHHSFQLDVEKRLADAGRFDLALQNSEWTLEDSAVDRRDWKCQSRISPYMTSTHFIVHNLQRVGVEHCCAPMAVYDAKDFGAYEQHSFRPYRPTEPGCND